MRPCDSIFGPTCSCNWGGLCSQERCIHLNGYSDYVFNKWSNKPKEKEDEMPVKLGTDGMSITFTVRQNIKKVIFNGPATIVIWEDGSKTVVKCMEGDTFNYEAGLALCISKKYLGKDFHKTFRKWCSPEDQVCESDIAEGMSFYDTLAAIARNVVDGIQ